MGNPSSKHCYFTGNYAGDGCVNLGTAKVYLKDNVGTLHPVKQQLGNYHCWIMRGAMLIDPTHDAFGKPADAFSDRLYFPFDESLASEVKDDLYIDNLSPPTQVVAPLVQATTGAVGALGRTASKALAGLPPAVDIRGEDDNPTNVIGVTKETGGDMPEIDDRK